MWKQSARSLTTPVLHVVRRGRYVAWTPDWMGIGNVLLLCLWAEEGRQEGQERWVLATAASEPWQAAFPGLAGLILPRERVRFFDRRVMPWSGVPASQEPRQLDIRSVESFVTDVLLRGSPLVQDLRDPDPDHLVINVRRGDYYTVPETRAHYGFDVQSYLRLAWQQSVERDGPPSRITVVSDDMDWCRTELAWLAHSAPTTWAERTGAVQDFRRVASARRVIITNSTFSYWAGHVSNVVWGDNHGQIWAPRFFDRSRNEGRSWLLDERWSIIEALPGGWAEQG